MIALDARTEAADGTPTVLGDGTGPVAIVFDRCDYLVAWDVGRAVMAARVGADVTVSKTAWTLLEDANLVGLTRDRRGVVLLWNSWAARMVDGVLGTPLDITSATTRPTAVAAGSGMRPLAVYGYSGMGEPGAEATARVYARFVDP